MLFDQLINFGCCRKSTGVVCYLNCLTYGKVFGFGALS